MYTYNKRYYYYYYTDIDKFSSEDYILPHTLAFFKYDVYGCFIQTEMSVVVETTYSLTAV